MNDWRAEGLRTAQQHIKNKVENRATSAHYDKQNVYIVPNKDAKYTMGEATNNTSSTGSSSPIEYGSVCITGVCSCSSTAKETKKRANNLQANTRLWTEHALTKL